MAPNSTEKIPTAQYNIQKSFSEVMFSLSKRRIKNAAQMSANVIFVQLNTTEQHKC